MMTTVLLIRHGMTDAVGRRIVGWLPGVGLNGEGLAQVERLARELSPVALDAIYSSPLERAARTAQAIADQQRHAAVIERPGLGEVRFGDWTGKTLDELDGDERWRRWSALRSCTRAPNGESMLETQSRMFDEMMHARERHPDAIVALVSHADAIRSLLVYLLGMSMDLFLRLRIDPASVSIVRVSDWSVEVAGVNLPVEGIASRLSPAPLVEHHQRR
jgi:broad specificity phosphatase PhoE